MSNKKLWVTCKNKSCNRIKHIERVCICGYEEQQEEVSEDVKNEINK